MQTDYFDQLREQGVGIVGCTANLTWDDRAWLEKKTVKDRDSTVGRIGITAAEAVFARREV